MEQNDFQKIIDNGLYINDIEAFGRAITKNSIDEMIDILKGNQSNFDFIGFSNQMSDHMRKIENIVNNDEIISSTASDKLDTFTDLVKNINQNFAEVQRLKSAEEMVNTQNRYLFDAKTKINELSKENELSEDEKTKEIFNAATARMKCEEAVKRAKEIKESQKQKVDEIIHNLNANEFKNKLISELNKFDDLLKTLNLSDETRNNLKKESIEMRNIAISNGIRLMTSASDYEKYSKEFGIAKKKDFSYADIVKGQATNANDVADAENIINTHFEEKKEEVAVPEEPAVVTREPEEEAKPIQEMDEEEPQIRIVKPSLIEEENVLSEEPKTYSVSPKLITNVEPAETCQDYEEKNHSLKIKALMGLCNAKVLRINTVRGISKLVVNASKKSKKIYNKIKSSFETFGNSIKEYGTNFADQIRILSATYTAPGAFDEIHNLMRNYADDKFDGMHQTSSELKAETICTKLEEEGYKKDDIFIPVKEMLDKEELDTTNKPLNEILENVKSRIDTKKEEIINDTIKETKNVDPFAYINSLIDDGKVDPNGKSDFELSNIAVDHIIDETKGGYIL